MKNILLIGLGHFGRHMAIQLNQLGHQIMAVDEDEERVNELLPYVTNAQIGDSTNADFLRSLGVSNYDVCFVTIGDSFQNSLETTSLLKELGAKQVISRAERDVQSKFLLRNGADEVKKNNQRFRHKLGPSFVSKYLGHYTHSPGPWQEAPGIFCSPDFIQSILFAQKPISTSGQGEFPLL